MIDLLSVFAQRLRSSGDGWTARCPAHDDARNSLSIGRRDDGRWLLKCHAGCSLDAILFAANLQPADLFPSTPVTGEPSRSIVATFDYCDETGTVLYQLCRFAPKEFRLRAADGSWSIKGIRRVLYRLPELHERRTVYVVEGEKDADRLWSFGLPATTGCGGAGKWRAEYAEMLKRAGCQQVIVLPDNDAPGEAHGRDVARNCVDAGLDVKVIPLPNLPPKGDVSDFLAHHTPADLLAIVKDAPLFTPHQLVASRSSIVLTSLSDFLGEPDDLVDWLVEDRIPAGAIVLFVAPPKAGKSTAARELAHAISRGDPWLGWKTTRGAVWLLILEDKPSEVRKHFRRLGTDGHEPIRLFVGQAPVDLLPQLHALAAVEKPALIIVDTLARVLKVKDFNDYAMVTQGFEPLLHLTRATGATLLLLSHSSVHVSRNGLDAVLGSTALSGSVDNILILKRTDQQRVLSSVQRVGPDLEPTVIVLNADTGRLERAGRKRDIDDAELGQRIVAALAGTEGPVPESWLQDQVGGRKADAVRVVRQLIGIGQVRRVSGAGRKGDPWLYGLVAKFGSQDSTVGRNLENAQEPQEPHATAENPGLSDVPDNSVPLFPPYSREQYYESFPTYLPTTKIGLLPLRQGDSVPAVPDPSQNSGNGAAGTLKTLDKRWLEIGSRLSAMEPVDEF